MIWLRITWTIFNNLIVILIYLGMLSIANTPFETIVIAGMGLIYVAIVTKSTQIERKQIGGIFLSTERFHKLVKAHNLPIEIEYEEKDLKEGLEIFNKMKPVFYINTTFSIFIWAVSVWEIIQSL